ncbi:transposase [Marinobacter salarius]|uniref:transposase n=1 Tax=Marinobacter salarius TaxID=1420917 RepID=UPI003D9A8308
MTATRYDRVKLGQGEQIGTISRSFGISEQSYYRWRREYGGLKVDQARRLKDLEKREHTPAQCSVGPDPERGC